MNINKINFSSSIINQNKQNATTASIAPLVSTPITAPQQDKVEISKPNENKKKNTTKYIAIGTGAVAAVLLLANYKKIGKFFSKLFSHNKNIEIQPTEIEEEIVNHIPDKTEIPKIKINVPFSEFKLGEGSPQHYFDRIASVKDDEDKSEDFYHVAKYIRSDIKEMCKINPECKFKNFEKELPQMPPKANDKEFFLKHLAEHKDEFIEEYMQCAKKERITYAQELNKILDTSDKETSKEVIDKLVSEVQESEYPADLVEKILKKENKEELIQTLFETESEKAKPNTAKAFFEAPEQNYSQKTMLILMKEISKSKIKGIINLDPVIEMFSKKELEYSMKC